MDNLNTNLSDYTMDDLFSLLDIKINNATDYNDLTKQIKSNTDKCINDFTSMKKPDIANFFKKVQKYLLEVPIENENKSSSTVITYDHNFNSTKEGPATEGNDNMFNSNNGAGNPIHRKTVSKLYIFDSKFRDNYNATTSTNYSIVIPEEQNNVIEMKLCDLELPSTYYPFNTANNNNYMWIKTHVVSTDTIHYNYIFIEEGNYYYGDLINYFQGSNGLGAFPKTPMSIQSNISYNNLGGVGTGTGTIEIGIFTPSDISANIYADVDYIELNFLAPPIVGLNYTTEILDPDVYSKYYEVSPIPINQKLGWMFGYRKGLYNTNQLYYLSESVLDVIGPKYLYLSIDDHQKSINSNFKTSHLSNIPGTVMARISLKGAAFNVLTQNDFSIYSEPRYYYGPVKISKFDILLLDEFGRIVDLNNNDFSFTLRLTVIYSAT